MATADRQSHAGESGPSLADTASLAARMLDDVFEALRAAGHLLRAELRLARSSLVAIIWLAFATLVFAFGAWLGLNVLAFSVVHAWTGSVPLGAGAVLLANLGGAVWCVAILRRCLRDLALPRTRRMFDRDAYPAPSTTHRARA